MRELDTFEREFKNTAFMKQNPPKSKKSIAKGNRAAGNTHAVLKAIREENKRVD